MVTGSLELGSGRPGKALRSGLRRFEGGCDESKGGYLA